jgi:hypothetical protein
VSKYSKKAETLVRRSVVEISVKEVEKLRSSGEISERMRSYSQNLEKLRSVTDMTHLDNRGFT